MQMVCGEDDLWEWCWLLFVWEMFFFLRCYWALVAENYMSGGVELDDRDIVFENKANYVRYPDLSYTIRLVRGQLILISYKKVMIRTDNAVKK